MSKMKKSQKLVPLKRNPNCACVSFNLKDFQGVVINFTISFCLNRTLYKDVPNGTPFNQNLPFWPDNLDEEFNYPNQDMNTAQENMTSQFMQQSLDNRIQQAQGVQQISRNF